MPKTATFSHLLFQRNKVQLAFNHIFSTTDAVVNLHDLCDISSYSPHHFQRLYSESFGESWGETLCRSRIYLAAQRLLDSTANIGDIAYLAGYETPVGFGKAFKKYFGVTPTRYRSDLSGEPFTPVVLAKKKCRGAVKPQAIVQLGSIPLYAKTGHGCKAGRFDAAGWSAFSELVVSSQNMFAHARSPVNWFGVIPSFRHFFKGDRAQYLAAVTIPAQLKGIKGVSNFASPAGMCAKFEHIGPLNEQTINAAIYDWLPASGYTLHHDRPILVDFGPINFLQYADQFTGASKQGLAYERLGFTADFLANSRVTIYIPLAQ